MSESDAEKIDLSLLDKNVPEQDQIKLLFICGIFFGFRGNTEHTFLECRRFTRGEFPVGHKFAGYPWFGIDFMLDKTHKLSVHKPYVRSINDTLMKLPVMSNDPKSLDPGSSIERFLQKLSPGQTRIYCKVIPDKYKKSDGILFYPHQPLGKDKILQLFRKGAKIMGIANPEEFMPHTLRHMLMTQVANDPNLSLRECMLTLRHESAAATLNYQHRTIESEENRLMCMGFVPPSDDKKTSTENQLCIKSPVETIVKLPSNVVTKEEKPIVSHSTSTPDINYLSQPDFTQETNDYLHKLEEMPCTQDVISLVKKDVDSISNERALVMVNKSKEREQILALAAEVRKLKKEINGVHKRHYIYECERHGVETGLDDVTGTPDSKKSRLASPIRNPYNRFRQSF